MGGFVRSRRWLEVSFSAKHKTDLAYSVVANDVLCSYDVSDRVFEVAESAICGRGKDRVGFLIRRSGKERQKTQ